MDTPINILTKKAKSLQRKIDLGKYGYSYGEKIKIEITQIDKAIKYLSTYIDEDFETCYFCKHYERKEMFCQSKKSNIDFVNGTFKCKYFKTT